MEVIMFNPDKLHDHHDIDALIRAAKATPTENMIQKLIDLEVDTNGLWVGFDQANRVWHQAVQAA